MRRGGAIPAPEVKLNQSMAALVVPNLPGTFPNIGGRHSNKAPSQPAREQEALESMPKLKSVVKKVHLDKAKPVNFKDLGPAARSRYDTTGCDWAQWDKSRPRTESSGGSKDDHSHGKPRSGHSDKGSSYSD